MSMPYNLGGQVTKKNISDYLPKKLPNGGVKKLQVHIERDLADRVEKAMGEYTWRELVEAGLRRFLDEQK